MGVLLLAGIFPLLISFYPPLRFWRNFKALSLTLAILTAVFGAWDVFAVWRGHWDFSPRNIYGFKIINLPVEEWLFFLVIPFCCIFTWEVLRFIKARYK
jgi:lycopene cyclase domain-containing protein